MYCSIIWNPASSLAVAAKVFSHLPSVFSCGGLPISRRATWYWKPPRTLTIQGVTTQVSEPNSNTACTTALKKNTDTRGSAPFLLSIISVLFYTALARDKFLTTASQSSSASETTRLKYWKEVTIFRRCS